MTPYQITGKIEEISAQLYDTRIEFKDLLLKLGGIETTLDELVNDIRESVENTKEEE